MVSGLVVPLSVEWASRRFIIIIWVHLRCIPHHGIPKVSCVCQAQRHPALLIVLPKEWDLYFCHTFFLLSKHEFWLPTLSHLLSFLPVTLLQFAYVLKLRALVFSNFYLNWFPLEKQEIKYKVEIYSSYELSFPKATLMMHFLNVLIDTEVAY